MDLKVISEKCKFHYEEVLFKKINLTQSEASGLCHFDVKVVN